MLSFSIDSAPGERENSPWRRGGLRFAFSWLDHGRIGRALEMTLHPFSAKFLSWQAQYMVRLPGDACRSAHCK